MGKAARGRTFCFHSSHAVARRHRALPAVPRAGKRSGCGRAGASRQGACLCALSRCHPFGFELAERRRSRALQPRRAMALAGLVRREAESARKGSAWRRAGSGWNGCERDLPGERSGCSCFGPCSGRPIPAKALSGFESPVGGSRADLFLFSPSISLGRGRPCGFPSGPGLVRHPGSSRQRSSGERLPVRCHRPGSALRCGTARFPQDPLQAQTPARRPAAAGPACVLFARGRFGFRVRPGGCKDRSYRFSAGLGVVLCRAPARFAPGFRRLDQGLRATLDGARFVGFGLCGLPAL